MLSTTTLLKHTPLATSLLLIALPIISFSFTGHALRILAVQFPGDRVGQWIWVGPTNINPTQEAWDTGKVYLVTLAYQVATENLVWVTGSFGVVAGGVGIWVWVRAVRYGESIYQLSNTSYINMLPLFLSSLTALLTLSSFIWASANHAILKSSSCDSGNGAAPNDVFTCSRELATCELITLLGPWRNKDERAKACMETKAARMLMLPLAVTAAVSFAVFALQMRKGARVERVGEKVWIPETWEAEPEMSRRGEMVARERSERM